MNTRQNKWNDSADERADKYKKERDAEESEEAYFKSKKEEKLQKLFDDEDEQKELMGDKEERERYVDIQDYEYDRKKKGITTKYEKDKKTLTGKAKALKNLDEDYFDELDDLDENRDKYLEVRDDVSKERGKKWDKDKEKIEDYRKEYKKTLD